MDLTVEVSPLLARVVPCADTQLVHDGLGGRHGTRAVDSAIDIQAQYRFIPLDYDQAGRPVGILGNELVLLPANPPRALNADLVEAICRGLIRIYGEAGIKVVSRPWVPPKRRPRPRPSGRRG